MTSEWQRAPYFRKHDPGELVVSKPTISLKKNWEGYRRATPRFFSC